MTGHRLWKIGRTTRSSSNDIEPVEETIYTSHLYPALGSRSQLRQNLVHINTGDSIDQS
jgi:hypothetical protein